MVISAVTAAFGWLELLDPDSGDVAADRAFRGGAVDRTFGGGRVGMLGGRGAGMLGGGGGGGGMLRGGGGTTLSAAGDWLGSEAGVVGASEV